MSPTRPEKRNDNPARRRWLNFERRLLSSVLFTGFPAVVLCLFLLWSNPYSLDHKLEGTVFLLLLWLGLSVSTKDRVIHSVQVLSNVIEAVKQQDFSFRAKEASPGDAYGDLAAEINKLAHALEQERLGTADATNLLRKVTSEAGAAIFAFSPDRRLRFVNRAGEVFLGKSEDQIVGHTAAELGVTDLLDPSLDLAMPDTISRSVSGIESRWIIRRTSFRQRGVPHRLVLLSEASEALRAEERLAWQRIIRVLGHEINNSLAPIKSIAHTLARQTASISLQEPVGGNLRQGLQVIEGRAESLNHFLQSYARLTKLPVPAKRVVALQSLVDRVVSLESRLRVLVCAGPAVYINVDPGQVEQALINLIKNSVEAVLAGNHGAPLADAVTVSWRVKGLELDLRIRDRGIGLLDTENLFVPFYTTKENGTGIGLILTRQIIEAHGGTLALRNCPDQTGCEVQINLPGCIESAVAAASG